MFKGQFILVVCLGLLFSSAAIAQKKMPTVNIKTLEGKSVSIQNVIKKDKITAVSFWATWCAPCKKELDAIKKVYPEWQKKYDFELIAVTIDDIRGLPKVKPMVNQKGWTYTVLSDVNSELKNALGFPTVPQLYRLDKEGKIVYSHSSYKLGDEKYLEEEIAKIAK